MRSIDPLQFFSKLRWLDRKPLTIEPYRQKIFTDVLYTFDDQGRLRYTLALLLRGKKNFKSLDLILAGLYFLVCRKVHGGITCLMVAFDEGQIDQNLDLLKKLRRANPALADLTKIKTKSVELRNGDGVFEIRPGQDISG